MDSKKEVLKTRIAWYLFKLNKLQNDITYYENTAHQDRDPEVVRAYEQAARDYKKFFDIALDLLERLIGIDKSWLVFPLTNDRNNLIQAIKNL